MKTKTLKKTMILMIILLFIIISVCAIVVLSGKNSNEHVSLSLFPDAGTRPSSSDFVTVGNRLISYKGNATVIRADDFPQGVETIGVNAFSTSSVEYVELPQTVKTLEGYCFYACETLKNIVIPSSCTSVASSAFNSCYGLENVVLQFDNPDVFSFVVFAFVTHDFNIYVPKDSYNSFYNSSKFSSVKDNLKIWNVNLTVEDYNNGQIYTANIAFGETVTLSMPIKEGYSFTGLTDSENKEYGLTFRWMSLEDCSLRANWEIKEFEIVYNGRDGNQYYLKQNGLTSTRSKIKYGELLDNDIIQTLYEDFRNAGEYLASVKINNVSVSNGMRIWDLGQDDGRYILDLEFAPKHYNLRFDSTYDDITFSNIDNLQYGDQVVLPIIPEDTKTGYLFDYWYVANTQFSGSRVVDFDTMQDCDPENNSAYINMWLEPEFAPKTYNVYLNANGGTCSTNSKIVTYDRYPNFPNATRSGYRFMGWEYNGERIDNKVWSIDQNNITVKAIWEKLYTVTMDADGGELPNGNTIEVIYGENIGDKLPTPTKDKHKFLYWTYNGQRIYNYTSWTVRSNGTVKAVWEELCRITLDAKGGYVSTNHIDLPQGSAIPDLPQASKEGYEFSGWYLNSIDFNPNNYYIEEDITLTTKWWDEVVLTDEESYTVTADCTYVNLKGILSNLAKPMMIYIDSNVENVKFSAFYIVSNKTIIVRERTKPLTIEFGTYQAIGYAGNAALDASECENLNIIARGDICNFVAGYSTTNEAHGGLICNNVSFYGNEIRCGGGLAGAIEISEEGTILDYYPAGAGIYAQGNISVNCEKLLVKGGSFALPMGRPENISNYSSKEAAVGIYVAGGYKIDIKAGSTLEVEGGKGLSSTFEIKSYVGHGGYGIKSLLLSTISGEGTAIIKGGEGGDNDDPTYQNHIGGNGGNPTYNIRILNSVNAIESVGLQGESLEY